MPKRKRREYVPFTPIEYAPSVPPSPYTKTRSFSGVLTKTYTNRYGEKTVTRTVLSNIKQTYDPRDDHLRSLGLSNCTVVPPYNDDAENSDPVRYTFAFKTKRKVQVNKDGNEEYVYTRYPNVIKSYTPFADIECNQDDKQQPPSYDRTAG